MTTGRAGVVALFPGSGANANITPGAGVLARRIGHEYTADRAVVESLGKVYGFSSLFVWQLTVADKTTLSVQERGYAGWLPQTPESKPAVEVWVLPDNVREEYEAVGNDVLGRGALDTSQAFDGMTNTAFIDWMHPTQFRQRTRRTRHLSPSRTALENRASTDLRLE